MVERKRQRVLNVRLGDDEIEMITRLADYDGISVSDWVRQTIRRAFRDVKPRRRKAGKRK